MASGFGADKLNSVYSMSLTVKWMGILRMWARHPVIDITLCASRRAEVTRRSFEFSAHCTPATCIIITFNFDFDMKIVIMLVAKLANKTTDISFADKDIGNIFSSIHQVSSQYMDK